MTPYDATVKAMSEVSGPVIAVALVLCAVFVPCAAISGITGQFFRQFALTIAVSTVLSALNSLTLSPALSALLLKPKKEQRDPLTKVLNFGLGWFFKLFNRGFGVATTAYTRVVGGMLRTSLLVLIVYGGLLYLTYYSFTIAPTGFIPMQDKGYMLVNVQLPDSASLERTQEVLARIERIALGDEGKGGKYRGDPPAAGGKLYEGIPGIAHTIGIAGQSVLLNANGSNFGSMYITFDEFHHRHGSDLYSDAIIAKLRAACATEVP